MLYDIIIYPIELIIELVFHVFRKILSNPGLAIVGVSLAVQILTLPLYNIAEKWQNVERETQKKMKPKVDKIKAAFKGDEQYMILSAFYKQQGYHPIFALRSTIGLLIQVPFFIAAYTFLSNLELLQGVSFYFIKNLGAQDELLKIGDISINILPIAMTLINIISGIVYTKDFPFREKIQLHVMAVLFLVLLYASPSGLVLYWTLNNLFSLVKNLICKSKNPAKLFYILASVSIVVVAIFCVGFIPDQTLVRKMFIVTISILIILIPVFILLLNKIEHFFLSILTTNKKQRFILCMVACVFLFLLAGFFIPVSLIHTSTQEFSFIDNYTNPLEFIKFPLLKTAGFFLVWIPLLFVLFSDKTKNIITFACVTLAVIAGIYTFGLQGNFGTISNTLQFETGINKMPLVKDLLRDCSILVFTCFCVLFLIKITKTKAATPIVSIASVSLFFLGCYNAITINSDFREYERIVAQENKVENTEQVYNLSKTKENVVIIMLDRAISSFIPYVFEEDPKIKEQFSGFTFYPNTVSVNGHTLMGSPPLYGGYEYVPENINKRTAESLVSKHNESLTVLPRLFSEKGFKTTITDASWANYSYNPDNSIFDDYPEITARNMTGKSTYKWANEHGIELQKRSELLERNLLFFSFFRMIPASFRGALYDSGKWWGQSKGDSKLKGFIDCYANLDYLPEATTLDSTENTFNIIVNESTHTSIYLQYPDYEPSTNITDIGENFLGDEEAFKTYHALFASIKKLGEYFDFMRESGVYDNTRIIIVSDHGSAQDFPAFGEFEKNAKTNYIDPARFNALLMVKDFYSIETVKTDMTFMCNADVPFLATEGIIENAKNPFTGENFSIKQKENGINVYLTPRFTPERHNTNTLILDGDIWHVKDNIFAPTCWTKVQ